jgi:chemotaxis family two-component system sensor kinase Cph1
VNPVPNNVNIDNCDKEPIHIPGAIQPHGVLLALQGAELRVVRASDNTLERLGIEPARVFGLTVEQILDPAAAQLIRNNAAVRSWKRFNPISAEVGGRKFDAIVHRSGDFVVVELEPIDLVAQGTYRDYGADTHQAMIRLQGAESLAELMHSAAEVVRWVTGYDRVMIYRFSEEGHGQVVAEDRVQSLEPFLGLHYPASDIPAQARHLYVLNWLRIIADVEYRRAELLSTPDSKSTEPLDLTYSALRSVSPIHIEYLRNMGVRASMSVSLVHDDKLWGLIACHYYSPKFIPYSVRMTFELLGHMLSTLILSWLRKDEAEIREAIGERRVRLLERLHRADYIAAGLTDVPEDLLKLVGASGAAILEEGRFTPAGACPDEDAVRAFAAWMAREKHDFLATSRIIGDFPMAPPLGAHAAGVLALGLHETASNAVLWFRPEVVQTVSWAGNPEKTYDEGPNGPRLNPRGSFKLWRETVQNQSERWSSSEIDAARELRAGLVDVAIRKAREAEQSRDMLLGMVSHDLRNPLGAISLTAGMLKASGTESAKMTHAFARIAASSDRMKRMIEQLLDYTRARSGSLSMDAQDFDLVILCHQLMEEIEAAHPGSRVELDLPDACAFYGDPGRIAQIISNLLGNARHHGDPAKRLAEGVRIPNGSPGPDDYRVAHLVYTAGEELPIKPLAENRSRGGACLLRATVLVGARGDQGSASSARAQRIDRAYQRRRRASSASGIRDWSQHLQRDGGSNANTRGRIGADSRQHRYAGLRRYHLWSNVPPAAEERMFRETAAKLPVGRIGTPEDVAEHYLSFVRGAYVTGQSLIVDGGGVLV